MLLVMAVCWQHLLSPVLLLLQQQRLRLLLLQLLQLVKGLHLQVGWVS